MSSPIVFRPWTGVAVTVLVGAVVVVSLVGLAIAGDVESLRRFGPAFVALAVLTAALFWLPAVIVSTDAVTVRNPLHTVVVPWGRIDDVESRFGMRLMLRPSGAVSAWAAPADARRANPRLLGLMKVTGSAAASERSAHEARERADGEAATYIRRVLAKRSAEVESPRDVVRTVNVPVVVALAVVIGAAVVFALT